MVILVVRNFFRAMLKPVRQSHVAVCEVHGISSLEFRRDGILLRKHKTHYLTELESLFSHLREND